MQTTDEYKQAKNVEQAKQARWMGLLLSTLGLLGIWAATSQWHDAPNVSSALDLASACAILLFGAFMWSDSKQVIRRNGNRYIPVGSLISGGLLMAVRLKRGFYKYGVPHGFLLFLGASTLLIMVCLLVLLYLRKVSARWEKQFNALKEADD